MQGVGRRISALLAFIKGVVQLFVCITWITVHSQVLVSPSEDSAGFFGRSVSGLGGDVNGDGRFDVIVGAPDERSGTSPDRAGRAYIFSGADGTVLDTLKSPNEELRGEFGYAVAGIGGDINADGIPDVLVGARNETVSGVALAGRVYIISGADGSVIHTLVSPYFQGNGYFGWSVAGVGGDINGDGIADVIIGAIGETVGATILAGRAYTFSGADGKVIDTLEAPNVLFWGGFGFSVAGIGGDLDSDGITDIIVGANELAANGSAYIFSGATGSVLDTLVSPNTNAGGFFGYAVSGIGSDVNNDGKVDIVVGAINDEVVSGVTNAGVAYIFSGADGTVLATLRSPHETSGGSFGQSISSIGGDINGDGFFDIVIGSVNASSASPTNAGRAYLYSSRDGTLLDSLISPNEESHGGFGGSVAGIGGDVNGDGKLDIVVGALKEDPGSSPTDAGRAYIFSSGNGDVIPIVLVSFDALPFKESAVKTSWSTVSEFNADYFKVERSKDLVIWEYVDAIDAAGTSTIIQQYATIDNDPYRGFSYYRLVQMDNDGKNQIYGPVTVHLEEIEVINLWPNPSTDWLNYEVVVAEEGTVEVKVLDELGRIVKYKEEPVVAGSNILTLALTSMAAGEYMIEVQTKALERSQRLFVIGEQKN